MAIVKREYTINAYWNSDDLLTMLETALADVSYHAAAQTGTILTFTNSAGTTILAEKGKRYLVKQSSTSGSGTYATFDIIRNAATGSISTITLVNGGINYAGTNTLTISGADIGGTSPTDDVTITVSTVSGSQGTTSTWYDKDTASPYTWGVCCVNNDITKLMGQTYYAFYIPANPGVFPTLAIKSGAGFQSNTNVYTGVSGLDFVNSGPNATSAFTTVIARSNSTNLKLITYQSSIDTNFVVFQFCDYDKYGEVYRDPFFLSKYNSATQPWTLDYAFTGGIYSISKSMVANTADASISITLLGLTLPKRAGEWGYTGYAGTGARTFSGTYESIYGRRLVGSTTAISTTNPVIYNRNLLDLIHHGIEYNPIITGIPICNVMVPVPYFLPADFGVSEIIGTNTITYKDLISIGSTTKWRILQYGNNQSAQTYNSAIAFVCKTVD